MPSGAASSTKALLDGLRESLLRLFDLRRQSQTRRRGQLQRQLLLGLELLWKVEEQVVLPALHDAPAGVPAAAVRRASAELGLLRDLGMLATRTSGNNRELTLAVLEGLATMHFEHGTEMLAAAPAGAANWPALQDEVRGLLDRWRREVQVDGEIEDEDRDPVGLPPR